MKCTIFILDDEVWIRKGIIQKIDWNRLPFLLIGEASNGRKGAELIRSLLPDILLLDIRMPGMNGLEVLQSIEPLLSRMKVIVISGFNEFEYVRGAMMYGVTHYLLKPVDGDELESALMQVYDFFMT